MGSLTSIVFGMISVLLVTGCKSELAMPSGGAAEISQSSSTLNPLTNPASSAHILSGKEAYDSSGNKVTGSLTTSVANASEITGNEDNDAVTQVTVTPGTNELFSSVLVNLGDHFQKANICAGKTIFGRLGTAACSLAFGSRGHRTPGSATERAIPVVDDDDDGLNGDNPVSRPNTSSESLGWSDGQNSCGNTQTTVAARIAHCNYSWDGEALGKMGEGKWSLVTKANGHEVWKDERTGMLWSGSIGFFDWCQASGNTENDGGIDCSAGNGLQPDPAISVCAESAGLESSGYDDPKGGMRLAATDTSPSVSWRLPTRNDYLQAYANGMGYVLPGLSDNSYWTASVDSGDRNYAWNFFVYSVGYVGLSNYYYSRGSNVSVRCVGR